MELKRPSTKIVISNTAHQNIDMKSFPCSFFPRRVLGRCLGWRRLAIVSTSPSINREILIPVPDPNINNRTLKALSLMNTWLKFLGQFLPHADYDKNQSCLLSSAARFSYSCLSSDPGRRASVVEPRLVLELKPAAFLNGKMGARILSPRHRPRSLAGWCDEQNLIHK